MVVQAQQAELVMAQQVQAVAVQLVELHHPDQVLVLAELAAQMEAVTQAIHALALRV